MIAVLHPRHKLSYFKNAGWEDEWIDAAERITRTEFERSYAHRERADGEEASTESNPDEEVHCNTLYTVIKFTIFTLHSTRLLHQISSTTFQHSPSPNTPNYVTSFDNTLTLIRNSWMMLLLGGLRNGQCTCVFHAWLWII